MSQHAFSVDATPSGQGIRTNGLQAAGLRDLIIKHVEPDVLAQARQVLTRLANYQIDLGRSINTGETIQQGYWLLQARPTDAGDLEIWELSADGSGFVGNAGLTLKYWSEQQAVCAREGAIFQPPTATQKTAVSVGVVEGDLPLYGVRYVAPEHMSGWYFTSDRYSGNHKDLRVDHLYHVTAARPEVAKYVALPAGYGFTVTRAGEEVFFDETVLSGA